MRALAFALGLVAGMVPALSANAADLIIHHAKITTLDKALPEASAVAVTAGKIVAVGTDADILKLRQPKTITLHGQGRRLLPGLNDSHAHYIRGGLAYNVELRWDGVPTLAEGLRMVKEQAARTPSGQWVRVIGGWTPHQFAERRLPTRAELDQASPERPVYAQYFYSRAVLNSAGLRALGITRDTEAPSGTRIERDADGDPTGILTADPHPGLLYQAIAALPALSAQDQANSTEQLYRTLARFGLTSFTDAGGGGQNFPRDYDVSIKLAEQGKVPLRVAFNLFAQRPGKEADDFRQWLAEHDFGEAFGPVPAGFFLHGAGEYLLWAAADFENFQSPRPTIQPAARAGLARVIKQLVLKRWPFSLHATYDETVSVLLDVIEGVDRETPLNGLRFSVDHAETIGLRNVDRIKALGGGVAVQSRMVMLGDDFVARYGAEKASASPPLRAILDKGVPLGLGTDATRGSTFNPWMTLHWVITGQTASGLALFPPENRLDRLTALETHTVGSAWFSGEEKTKGRIAPGQSADLILLSDDYFAVTEEPSSRSSRS